MRKKIINTLLMSILCSSVISLVVVGTKDNIDVPQGFQFSDIYLFNNIDSHNYSREEIRNN